MFRRFWRQPGLSLYVLGASLFIHLLGLASTVYVIQVFNRYVSYGLSGTLITLTAGVVIALVFEFSFRLVRQRFVQALCLEPEAETATMVASTVSHAATDALTDQHHPRYVMQTLEQWSQTYSPTNLSALVDAPFAVLFVFVIALLNVDLALIVVGAIVVMIIVERIGRLVQGRMQQALREKQQETQAVSRSLQEVDTVRAFNIATPMVQRWTMVASGLRALRYKAASQQNAVQSLTTAMVALTSVAVVAWGSVEVVNGSLTVGAVIGANILTSRALAVLTRVVNMAPALVQAEQAHTQIGSFLRVPTERQDGMKLQRVTGRLEFVDFTFQYPGALNPVIKGLHGTVEPGEVLVISGDNGVGKTTMARALAGMVHPQDGSLLVEGYDLRQVDMTSWRRQLVYLPQEPRFFEGSMEDNLRALNPQATEETIMQALAAVGLDTFVRRSKDGLQAMMTTQSEHLAYGVRRRLALVRGLLGGGQVWVLDEIAEGIDPKGLRAIAGLIREATRVGRTIVICSSSHDVYQGPRKVLELGGSDAHFVPMGAEPTDVEAASSTAPAPKNTPAPKAAPAQPRPTPQGTVS